MPQRPSHHPDDGSLRGFVFSPASCYPIPVAYVVDDDGRILHTWSHPADQPERAAAPPSYLRGWNHVEVDAGGNLFAIVPLRSLLKLTPASELEWSCDVAAHHDMAVRDDGSILVLTEAPRRVVAHGATYTVLDNLVALIEPGGTVKEEFSVYDILRAHQGLGLLIDESIRRRSEEFHRRQWPRSDDAVPTGVVEETWSILQTATYDDDRRQALRRLRDLPGSPCDILHTNTLELLDGHPRGLWDRGDVLLCMRELNTIAVVNLARGEVRWSWGTGVLSGPHQPSVLPDGRVLVFDNGISEQRTRLLAVEPSTDEVVWSWSEDPPQSFYCPLAGGCELLANGNLLVTNSTAGAAFELTMEGEVVWQLKLPASVYGADKGRVSIYRMSALKPNVVDLLRRRIPAQRSSGGSDGLIATVALDAAGASS
jgi:hypothetical protein